MSIAYSALIMLYAYFNYRPEFWERTTNNAWLIVYVLVHNFMLFEYSVPFINISWKRLLWLPVLAFIHIILLSIGIYAWRYIGIALHLYRPIGSFKSIEAALEYFMQYSVAAVFFFGITRHLYRYIKLKQATQQLRIQKQEAELNYLKSQTNPHFLFNTLNNIYALAKDKSDLAPEAIIRLSKILRYMLYETGGQFVAIEQELKIVHDYIALEKLRYDDSLRINFNYDVEDMKQALPPLLLVPLVENAFKHGVSETRGNPFVDIHLAVNQRQLKFMVKNSADKLSGEHTLKEKIGLANLRRQLELLYREYDLTIQQQENEFSVVLKINLASHV